MFPKSLGVQGVSREAPLPADVVEIAPGGRLDVQSEITQGGALLDVDAARLPAYLSEYQAAVMPPAAPPTRPADLASLRDGLVASLQRKLDVHGGFTDRLKMPPTSISRSMTCRATSRWRSPTAA